jgi:sulfite exporter TauE/SafE
VGESTAILCGTAATIGVVHTLLGPDHYLPFLAMSRAGRWSRAKTLGVTAACGAAHVLSSVALGAVGIAVGAAVFTLEALEAARGQIAGWMLIAFGAAYTVWGLRRAYRNRPHRHWHAHADGTVHDHDHTHDRAHAHVHAADAPSLTPWVLFTIFVFGPCEPLIPILMYPAAQGSMMDVMLVTAVFGMATLGTMLTVVFAAGSVASWIRVVTLERYAHVVAGATIVACGLAVKLGL